MKVEGDLHNLKMEIAKLTQSAADGHAPADRRRSTASSSGPRRIPSASSGCPELSTYEVGVHGDAPAEQRFHGNAQGNYSKKYRKHGHWSSGTDCGGPFPSCRTTGSVANYLEQNMEKRSDAQTV